jgi:hypothetical protein
MASSPMSWRAVPSGSRRGTAMSWKQTATCSRPSATATPPSCAEISATSIWIPGRARLSSATAAGTIVAIALAKAPSRNVSRSAAASSAICMSACASRAAIASACASSSAPASVGAGPPGPRSRRRTPSWRSSAAICCETAGWVSASTSAARENERRRATSPNVSRRRGSSIHPAYAISKNVI